MKHRLSSLLVSSMLFSCHLNASKSTPVQESILNIETACESSPFPIGRLNKEILDEFMPLIMEEVSHEFARQDDLRTVRDTRQYGLNFFKMLNGDFSYVPPPEFLQRLGAYICDALGHEPPDEFTNIILSVYDKGFHLEPHVDVNIKDLHGDAPFYFAERVYGIIIEPDPTGHLYFAKWEGEGLVPPLNIEPIYTLEEVPGTVFCLEGAFRQTPYFHAVSAVSNYRISITFRTVERMF